MCGLAHTQLGGPGAQIWDPGIQDCAWDRLKADPGILGPWDLRLGLGYIKGESCDSGSLGFWDPGIQDCVWDRSKANLGILGSWDPGLRLG